eukprot:12180863-Heterocapsa_arctica.AAC.1
MVKRTKALALAVREKVNIIKTAGQSKATYGAATNPFTQAEITSLRTNSLRLHGQQNICAAKLQGSC